MADFNEMEIDDLNLPQICESFGNKFQEALFELSVANDIVWTQTCNDVHKIQRKMT